MFVSGSEEGVALHRLFKRTAKGAVQIWDIEVDIPNGRYRMISGQLGGKQTTSEWTVAKAKNVGRANEVGARVQAVLEAKAAWEKKKRDGYAETAEAAQESTTFQCMLATNWTDPLRRKEALYAASHDALYSQPKLDGVRCIATRHGLMSRKNRPIVSVPHIAEALEGIFAMYPDAIIDGELYNHELKEDFNEIIELCRKSKPTEEDLAESRGKIQYHVYDCVNLGVPRSATFSQRNDALFNTTTRLLEEYGLDARGMGIHLVGAKLARNQEEIDRHYAWYLEAGYEGQMLRIDEAYENKRSAKLLKRKEHDDEEFEVLRIFEGVGNASGMAGFVTIRDLKTGVESKANVKGDRGFRRKLLLERDHYHGGQVTVRFNGRTPDGVPRFPRALHDRWHPEGRQL
jgi:DNA ligase 1